MEDFKVKFKSQLYYWLIGILSIVSLIVLPLLGSQFGDITFNLPNTPAGWVLYIISNGSIALINMLIFFNFMQQAKLNVQDLDPYKKATKILQDLAIIRSKKKQYKPQGPKEWQAKQYVHKGTKIFIFTLLSVFGFSQAIISFDTVALITYFFTLSIGLVFGIIQMKRAELYWTTEYLDYAQLQQELLKHDMCPKVADFQSFDIVRENHTEDKENHEIAQNKGEIINDNSR